MKIKPLGNRAVVKLIKKPQTSSSGIIISTTEKEEQSMGEIIAVGTGLGTEENIKELGLKDGDKIIFGKYAGEELKEMEEGDVTYKILNGKDIMGIITK
jgi:chaperonin GroES